MEVSNLKTVECRECGRFMSIGIDAASGTCSSCTQMRVIGLLSEDERKRLFSSVIRKTGSSKPRGWRWRKEFVDTDGTVFYKGVEQPKLKGTLPPTNVEKIKASHKANKSAKKVAENKKLLKHAAKAKAAKKEVDVAFSKQKEFLDGHTK